MGTFTGQALINELAERLRDTSNVAYPRASVLRIINLVQDNVNVRLGLVHANATLITDSHAIYSLETLTRCAYPVQVFGQSEVTLVNDGVRELDYIPFNSLVRQEPDWLRKFGQRSEIFSTAGRNLLIILPVPIVPETLKVRYVTHPTALADDNVTQWDLPDEFKPLVLDLCEAVLLLRARDFHAIQDRLSRAANFLGLEDVAQITRHATPGEQQKPNA